MEEYKIGINRDIAICFKVRVKHNKYRLEPIKVIEGFYSITDGCFYDQLGKEYYHISDIESIQPDNLIFAGKISIPNNLKELDLDLEAYKELYLKEFKKYTFRFSWKDVVARNKETGKECLYTDDLTEFKYELEDAYFQLSPNINKNSEDYIEESKKSEINKEENADNKTDHSIVEESKESKDNRLLTPKEISDKLIENVKGQNEAILKIATIIYKKYKYPNLKKTNMLLIGPTGVGKTYIFEQLSKLLNIPLIIYDVTGTSQAGYKGKEIEEMLYQLIIASGGDLEKAQRGIIIVDEIDKLAYKDSNQGVIATEGVQNELLKIIEGTKIIIRESPNASGKVFDTSNILFVGMGAFQKLQEDKKQNHSPIGFTQQKEKPENDKAKDLTTGELSDFGIKKELLGRLPLVISLNPLTEEILCEILSTENSELTSVVKICEEAGITITNLEEFKLLIAKDAINKNIGARGLSTTIANMFVKILYEIFNNIGNYDTLTLGANIINDYNDFTLSSSKTETTNLTKKLVQ